MSMRDFIDEFRRYGILTDVGPATIFGWITVLTMLAVIGAAVKFILT